MDMNLLEYFNNNKGRGIYKFPHYFEIYTKYFEQFVGKDAGILEIGVKEGGSLIMWKEYFGEKARVYGVDLNDSSHVEGEQIKTFMGDQSDKEFLKDICNQIPSLDIIIDDGSHRPNDQLTSFEVLFPKLNENGIYLIEDMNHNYAENEGGGYKNFNSALEYFKDLIDYLYGYFDTDRGDTAKDISRNIYSLSFYYNVVVIEKRDRTLTHVSPYRTGDWKYKELYG